MSSARRTWWRRLLRSALALVMAAGLALGGAVFTSNAGHAKGGPDDITMPDDNLRAFMNRNIASNTGVPRLLDQDITVAEAALLTGSHFINPGTVLGEVTTLTGIEHFTGIQNLSIIDMPIDDLAPLADLSLATLLLVGSDITSLPTANWATLQSLALIDNPLLGAVDLTGMTSLDQFLAYAHPQLELSGSTPASLFVLGGIDLSGGGLSDREKFYELSAVQSSLTLNQVSITNTELADLSPLTEARNLAIVGLENNRILDLSPLPASVTILDAKDQEVTVASVALDTPFENPVKNIDGSAVPVTSTDAGFSFDAVANTWTFATPGVKTLAFVDNDASPRFSGTITQTVTEGAIVSGTATISGTAKVGEALTTDPGTWAPADVMLAYEWLVDGAPVTGETGTTFTPRAEDSGKEVMVRVTATKPGFTAASTTSDPVTVAPAAIIPPTAGPAILGLPQVGQRLNVQQSEWRPADVTLGYQWHVDGAPVTGATGTTFRPHPEHAGKAVTVRVSASKPGYAPATANSAAVTIAVPKIAGAKARAKAGENVTFTGVNFGPREDVRLVLHPDPVPLGTAKADQNGAFSATIVMPSHATVGGHFVVAVGADTQLSASLAFEVLAPAAAAAGAGSASGSLQQTNAATSPAMMIPAAALLLAGLGLGGAQLVAKRRVG